MYDVVILTDKRYEDPKSIDWYIQQVLTEDQLLILELKKLGLRVIKKAWDSSSFNWSDTKFAVFRSTWDYFDKFKEFKKWLEKVKKETIFINSYELINWNLDKKYLIELNKKGINIPTSVVVTKKDNLTLANLFKKYNFNEAIIKPTISGAARDTYRITKNNFYDYENNFFDLKSKEDLIFQEFLSNIISQGEISLIFIGRKYTHAVKKIAKEGDFRVQDDHGGSVEVYNATKEEILFAQDCLEKCPVLPIYSRIDIIYDNKNEICLGEIEVIEPELWFRNNKNAAKLLASEINKLF
jgi:glutathione synthase/RimK-type ligase-like ATP-grasp enzyme